MKKHFAFLGFIGLVFSVALYSNSADTFVIKSALFKTISQETGGKYEILVSMYSVPIFVPSHPTYKQLEKIELYRLINELRKIYKIESVENLSSGILLWDGNKDQVSGLIVFKETFYPLIFTPKMLAGGELNVRIQISKQHEAIASPYLGERLFDTEMVMSSDTPYVLGFPSGGSRYFLYISFTKKKPGQYEEQDYSKIMPPLDLARTPEPAHTVAPVYPPDCLKEKIEGKVLLMISIDKQGKVMNVKTMNQAHPTLRQAAMEALRQWDFEPVMKKDEPISVEFPVMVDFKLRADPVIRKK
jgi:TonB family protein